MNDAHFKPDDDSIMITSLLSPCLVCIPDYKTRILKQKNYWKSNYAGKMVKDTDGILKNSLRGVIRLNNDKDIANNFPH